MFGLTGYDISPLLTEWQNNININATIKFSKFITWELDDKKDRLITSFKTDELSEKIINWAFSEPVKGHFKKQIENILFQLNIKLDEHIKNEMIWTYDSIK